MKKNFYILVCILLFSCKEQPKIPISNTLEIALGKRYSAYVNNLNKAFEKDSTALLYFFKIDYINDAAGYDHGYILYQLIKIYGDEKFANALQKTTAKGLQNVSQYVEVGIDANDRQKNEMKINYPISSNILKIK
ncbi:hypothetical protein GA0116948_1307 [Chitinophaga costaii]|uniref:Uncharacterized protein n=1 Tax=Chitinophaga costaii TaxID=1335309 RepID=A0A1C4G855_9BACT|nr:hypothetical protein [Chitinophaga costaii]PUZ19291.1 hypothetical protein DCM91_20715 [Chitinophaga costaii]SCC64370.1 hypothetical protein GA0116948_1307 [Chitinophaga costaii]